MYQMAAILTGLPEFMIGTERATLLASAMSDVSKHYNISSDGPALSLVKLAVAVGVVNLPIFAAVAAKRKEARAAKQRPAQPATPEDAIFDGITPKGGTYRFDG